MYNYFEEIEEKYYDLIQIAKDYMSNIQDYEHNMTHINDVVSYTKELLNCISEKANAEVCIISAYWHDVGRTKCGKGHEKISAEMLKEQMTKLGYDEKLINDCYKAIENHKWDMCPETIEGHIIRDADKLDWVGVDRWKECLDHNQIMDSIIESLPILRNELLHFDESKKIYDREIVELLKFLTKKENKYGISL